MTRAIQFDTEPSQLPQPLQLLFGDAQELRSVSVLEIARSVLEYVSRVAPVQDRADPLPEPSCLRRAEEYILVNAADSISIAALADAARVSVSTLYASFRVHRGCSPMERVREHRLQLARTQLLAGRGHGVAQVAFACGFEHLGRFSVRYRARFGESPSQTLRYAKGTPMGG